MQQQLCKNCGLRHPLGQCKGDGTSAKPVGVSVAPIIKAAPPRSAVPSMAVVTGMKLDRRAVMGEELRAILASDGLDGLAKALRDALGDTDAKVAVQSKSANRDATKAKLAMKRAKGTTP